MCVRKGRLPVGRTTGGMACPRMASDHIIIACTWAFFHLPANIDPRLKQTLPPEYPTQNIQSLTVQSDLGKINDALRRELCFVSV